MLVAGVGGPGVLPQVTLRDQGYKGTIYQTHGVATDDFIRLGKDKVEGTVLAAGPMLVIDEIADSNPIKRVALTYITAYEKQFGQKPATFGANTWDAGLILERAIPTALKKAKPGTEAFRTALRDAIEQEREIIGCQGVFNMSATNHNGMDERARVLVTVKDGQVPAAAGVKPGRGGAAVGHSSSSNGELAVTRFSSRTWIWQCHAPGSPVVVLPATRLTLNRPAIGRSHRQVAWRKDHRRRLSDVRVDEHRGQRRDRGPRGPAVRRFDDPDRKVLVAGALARAQHGDAMHRAGEGGRLVDRRAQERRRIDVERAARVVAT